MGKRSVRIVAVPKLVTFSMLVLVSAAIGASVWALSGHAYASGRDPLRQLFLGFVQGTSPVPPRSVMLAAVMPFVAHALLFVPWGFLLFAFIDRPSVPRFRNYLLTVLFGLFFALAMVAWQAFLPTPVMKPSDALANACGALAGAALAHLRRRVRVRFEI